MIRRMHSAAAMLLNGISLCVLLMALAFGLVAMGLDFIASMFELAADDFGGTEGKRK